MLIVASNAQAIILYSGDNSANLMAPDTARTNIFNSVAKICESNGEGMSGSSVYLKGKYLLTAKHVLYKEPPNENVLKEDIKTHITFNGIDLWEIDYDFSPIQISSTDLIIFKLINDPGLPETELYSSTNERLKSASSSCLIGWGYGRDSSQVINTDDPRPWNRSNNNSTINKRWGTNKVYTTGSGLVAGYNYSYLMTILDADAGNDEAAITYLDSGGGLFLNNSGAWQLAGISTASTNPNISNFTDNSGTWHQNIFVRISQYKQTILNNIPDKNTYSGWAIDNSLYGTDAEINADPDGDGLDNQSEFNLNTNPNLFDSDSDGLSDSDEVNIYQSNPNNSDTSNDGLSDQEIVNYGLDPNADHTLLYNAIIQSVADLREGSTIIGVIDNQATITLNLESSNDLISWIETGNTATLQVSTTSDTQFYRFKLSD